MSRKRNKRNNLSELIILLCIAIITGITGYFGIGTKEHSNKANEANTVTTSSTTSISLASIPEYNQSPYIEINNNKPTFSENEYTTKAFETYSDLDSLGRCGIAYANICKEIMPSENEKRGAISSVKPTGWQTAKYPGTVDGNYLYNRCHLIGYQLAGENANEKNLITGTRYMNVEGMLPFENTVDDYIDKHPKNHVLYRVTPIFENQNLVANGVQMEAYSVEDNGQGISFNIYVYNVQPGIEIDYKTGNPNLNLNDTIYGLDLQLPIYLFLAKNKFSEARIIGFYLQKILNNEIKRDNQHSYLELKKENLKLQGYSNSDTTILSLFDNGYFDSKVIKGMKMTSKGLGSKKVLDDFQMENLSALAEVKIKEAIQGIIDANFSINPKRIGNDNVGCKYCLYRDICFMSEKDIVDLEEYKNLEFLKGENT